MSRAATSSGISDFRVSYWCSTPILAGEQYGSFGPNLGLWADLPLRRHGGVVRAPGRGKLTRLPPPREFANPATHNSQRKAISAIPPACSWPCHIQCLNSIVIDELQNHFRSRNRIRYRSGADEHAGSFHQTA